MFVASDQYVTHQPGIWHDRFAQEHAKLKLVCATSYWHMSLQTGVFHWHIPLSDATSFWYVPLQTGMCQTHMYVRDIILIKDLICVLLITIFIMYTDRR